MEPEELNVSPIVFMPLASYKSITFHISAYWRESTRWTGRQSEQRFDLIQMADAR
jgi:hypothetical protein